MIKKFNSEIIDTNPCRYNRSRSSSLIFSAVQSRHVQKKQHQILIGILFTLVNLVGCGQEIESARIDREHNSPSGMASSVNGTVRAHEPSEDAGNVADNRFSGEHYLATNSRGGVTAAGYAKGGANQLAPIIEFQELSLEEQLQQESPIRFRATASFEGWYEEYAASSTDKPQPNLRVEFHGGYVSAVKIWQENHLVIDSVMTGEQSFTKMHNVYSQDTGQLILHSETTSDGCQEEEISEHYFKNSRAVERRYRISRDTCKQRSTTVMHEFFPEADTGATPYKVESKSVAVRGCEIDVYAKAFFSNGSLEREYVERNGRVVSHRIYNERGRRVASTSAPALDEIRRELKSKKCHEVYQQLGNKNE